MGINNEEMVPANKDLSVMSLLSPLAQGRGPKGDKGDPGPQGPEGPEGPQGPEGEPATQEQVDQAVASMIDDSVASQIEEPVEAAAGAWLTEHVDPSTGYVLDNSLTVQGAAADAKAAGDRIKELQSEIDVLNQELIMSPQNIVSVLNKNLANKYFSIGDIIACSKASAVTASKGSSTGITGVTVDFTTFLAKIGSAVPLVKFVYTNKWYLDGKAVTLSEWGISVTGTAAQFDEILVSTTLSNIEWIISNISPQGDWIEMHTKYVYNSCVFGHRQALYAFPNGLAAGTYYFKKTADSWVSGDVNKWFSFTLANAIPAGGQLYFSGTYNVTWDGKNIASYSAWDSTTAIDTVALSMSDTEPSTGTSLGNVNNTIQAADENIHVNCAQRVVVGHNRYSKSYIRQYINSDASSAEGFYEQQSEFDRVPSKAAGWLYGLDKDFVDVVTPKTVTIAKNTVCDGGGSETVTDKFFLLSRSEIYGGEENSINEGDPWAWFADNSDLDDPGTGADTNRIKTNTSGSAQYWWNRSPSAGTGYNVRFVDPSGAVYISTGYNSGGCVPACRISSNL